MRVFIGCSASDNIDTKYKELATNLTTYLAKNNHKLVFGGSDSGMMGKCYYTFKYEGGKIKAVVEIHDKEVLDYIEVDAYEATTSTFDRTKLLFESSDLVIILPGGIGTYAEFFSMLDEVRQKKLNKNIILFNYENFYTPLLNFLKNTYGEGFIDEKVLKMFNVVNDLKSLEKYIEDLNRNEE